MKYFDDIENLFTKVVSNYLFNSFVALVSVLIAVAISLLSNIYAATIYIAILIVYFYFMDVILLKDFTKQHRNIRTVFIKAFAKYSLIMALLVYFILFKQASLLALGFIGLFCVYLYDAINISNILNIVEKEK